MDPWVHDISWQGRLALFIAGAPKFDTLRLGSDKGHWKALFAPKEGRIGKQRIAARICKMSLAFCQSVPMWFRLCTHSPQSCFHDFPSSAGIQILDQQGALCILHRHAEVILEQYLVFFQSAVLDIQPRRHAAWN